MTPNFKDIAANLVADIYISDSISDDVLIVQNALAKAYADGRSEGFADGYNERDTEIPTGE